MSLFGGDPISRLLDDEYRQRKEKETAAGISVGADWPYAVTPVKTTDIAGRQMLMKADDGTTYAGSFVREMLEARRYRPKEPTWFGYTNHPVRGVEEVGVPHQSLFKHSAIFGTTGYGKSTVMKNMMNQWIEAGYGLAFLDPKGDDSLAMLKILPTHRLDDVLWVEPGAAKGTDTVGFNFFDTYTSYGSRARQQEADQITDNFIALIKASTMGWSSQMGGVLRAIIEPLILAEENYTPIDLFKILTSPSERVAFLEMYGDDIEELSRSYISDLDEASIDPMVERLREIAEKPVLREMLANEGSSISMSEVVEESKILLIRASNIGEDLEFIAAAVVRRIWSTIQARADIPEDEKERTPFYLCIDEFDKVIKEFEDAPDMMKIGNILSKARSLRLSLLLANQQPSQIPEDIQQDVQGNCDNTFSFGLANYQDASPLAQTLNVEPFQITGLGPFRLLGRVTIDGDKTDPLLITTFPEYPPVRSSDDCDRLTEESIARYGVPKQKESVSLDDFGVARFNRGHSLKRLTDGGAEINQRHILVSLYAASFHSKTFEYENTGGWVPEERLKRGLLHHAETHFTFDDIRESLIKSLVGIHIDQHHDEPRMFYRLTSDPSEMIFGDDADPVRVERMMQTIKTLGKLGFDVTLPLREGGLYDIIAEPPIKPTQDAETMGEATKLYESLCVSHPELAERFEDTGVVCIISTAPLDTPREMAAALAASGNRHCIYVVPEESSSETAPSEALTLLLSGSFSQPAFVKSVDEESGARTFYTSGKLLSVDGEQVGRALHKASEVSWQETEDGKVALVDQAGVTLGLFDSAADVARPVEQASVPYHCYFDEAEGGVVVAMSDGDIEGVFKDMEHVSAEGFTVINEPFIPEMVFPTADFDGSDSEWSILVVPESEPAYFY
jgi:hypothetical protein